MSGGYFSPLRGKVVYRIDYAQTKALYDKGLVDSVIADKIGVTKSAVTEWRHRNRLPANGPLREYDWRAHGFPCDPKQCNGCVFWRPAMGGTRGAKFCHHLLDTDKRKVVVNEICQSRSEDYGQTIWIPEETGREKRGYESEDPTDIKAVYDRYGADRIASRVWVWLRSADEATGNMG